jgi:hypothetical protein
MRLLGIVLVIASGLSAAEIKIGKPLALKQATSIAQLNASPEQFVGKNVQVKGRVTEVCQMMGCWMAIAHPHSDEIIRIQVKDGELVFPNNAAGKTAVAEGKFVKIEMTKEQALARAKHEAEENGRKFDPAAKVSTTIYQVEGTGAVLID